MSKLKTAVLISGRGSNMGALARAAIDPDYPAEIVLVLSNRPHVAGLDLAMEYGVPFKVVDHTSYESRAAHDTAVTQALEGAQVEFVCLAGYMRILGEDFVKHWRGRLINIHPSLLPSFRGVDTHARALERGVRVHGCTAHFVNAEMDGGPVVAQSVVPVLPDDNEDSLAQRVLDAEHILYPHVLSLIARGLVRWSGDSTVVDCGASAEDLLFVPSDGASDA